MKAIRAKRERKAKALIEAIDSIYRSIDRKSTPLFSGYSLSTRIVDKHEVCYARFNSDEVPILATNDCFVDAVKRYGWTGLFITDHALYYHTVSDFCIFGLVPLYASGDIPLDQVHSISIGSESRSKDGQAYIGHQLIINDITVGLLRMGGNVEFAPEMIAHLETLFRAIED